MRPIHSFEFYFQKILVMRYGHSGVSMQSDIIISKNDLLGAFSGPPRAQCMGLKEESEGKRLRSTFAIDVILVAFVVH